MECLKNLKVIFRMSLTAVLLSLFLCGCEGSSARERDIMTQLSENRGDEDVSEESVENEDLEETKAQQDEQKEIYVYVCGAVENPGVYTVNEHDRLFEVIGQAGGFTDDADTACLNLAREAEDGEQIFVLTTEETSKLEDEGIYSRYPEPSASKASKSPNGSVLGGLVNINTASASELTTVSGIGESRAQAIIAYRESNGAFASIEDIKKVDGIKDGLFSKIKDQITV